MQETHTFTHLSDRDLLTTVARLASEERRITARLVASLAELDARQLYLQEGCSSLFTYCTEVLRLSEGAAYKRIAAARAVRKFPAVGALLADGSVSLATICLLAPNLTAENHLPLLEAVRHRSKREVERLVAALRPEPDVRAEVRPVAVGRYQISLTIDEATYGQLRRVQDLIRHSIPDGDLSRIFGRAIALLLAGLERSKLGAARRPRPSHGASRSRHVPAAVKRAIWHRDGGCCAFVGTAGRCSETSFLEYHHVVPYADGGRTDVLNIELRCRAHNRYEADEWFGPVRASDDSERGFLSDPPTGPGAS